MPDPKPSAGVTARPGDLVLVQEAEITLHRSGRGGKLEHERWTGPWRVSRILQEGLTAEVEMKGRQLRTRKVHTGLIKPFHVRPRDLRHSMADEFAQYAWSSEFALTQPSVAAQPLYTLVSRREFRIDSGARKWE